MVPKSFLEAILMARVRALLRDGETDMGGAYGFGGGGNAVTAVGEGPLLRMSSGE